MPSLKSKFKQNFLERPIAHRALHDAKQAVIENSLEAIDAAIQAGFPIEIDLQNTKDARSIVFHDAKLGRVTDIKGYVRDKTCAEMEELPLKYSNSTISYLSLLDRVDGQVPLLVEIKDQSGELGEDLGSFMPDIIKITKSYQGPIALMSFNPYIVRELRLALPDHPLGLTTCDFSLTDWPNVPTARRKRLRELSEIPSLDFDFISHDWRDLKRVADVEKPILCWTIKSEAQEKKAREIADNITFEGYMPK